MGEKAGFSSILPAEALSNVCTADRSKFEPGSFFPFIFLT